MDEFNPLYGTANLLDEVDSKSADTIIAMSK